MELGTAHRFLHALISFNSLNLEEKKRYIYIYIKLLHWTDGSKANVYICK